MGRQRDVSFCVIPAKAGIQKRNMAVSYFGFFIFLYHNIIEVFDATDKILR